MKKFLSVTDMVVIVITFALFLIALFVKGITQAILIEAGVLLVSVKIIIMNYKNSQSNESILEELDSIKKSILELKDKMNS